MGLNKSQGNMYPWVTHTWNPIQGKCPHDCSYCYMRRFWEMPNYYEPLSFRQQDLTIKLGHSKKIFVGSSIDIWAEDIPEAWIFVILAICQNHIGNEYLFQTKNSKRLFLLKNNFPQKSTLGITLESNRSYLNISKAPDKFDRIYWMNKLSKIVSSQRMISIEPILDFDLEEFVWMINQVQPSFVSIGADSKKHHLLEPSSEKIKELITRLKSFTEVKIKDNLKRLL